jgi:hypothetical protein
VTQQSLCLSVGFRDWREDFHDQTKEFPSRRRRLQKVKVIMPLKFQQKANHTNLKIQLKPRSEWP